MSYIYIPNKTSIVQKHTHLGTAPQGIKKTIFADQSARTSMHNRVSRATNTVQKSYNGYYKKDEKPVNTINNTILRVRGGGSVTPFKCRHVAPL